MWNIIWLQVVLKATHADLPTAEYQKGNKYDTCGVVLNSRTVLLDHVQGKHGDKLHTCPCGKSYSWRPSLARHKKACKSAKVTIGQ